MGTILRKTMHEFDKPEFKEAFWKWFDSLPCEERRKFQNYTADMAELNFYNRVYKNNGPMADR